MCFTCRRGALAHHTKNSKDMTSADYYDRNRGPIEQLLSEAVSEVMREEPTDPFQYLADYLARRALEERQRHVICVSDIHGRCDELKALWDALTKELGEELARTPVVFLGECVLRSALESHVARREPRLIAALLLTMLPVWCALSQLLRSRSGHQGRARLFDPAATRAPCARPPPCKRSAPSRQHACAHHGAIASPQEHPSTASQAITTLGWPRSSGACRRTNST